MVITFLLRGIYFYLPVGMANFGANLGKFIPGFKNIKVPVDFGLTYRGKRLVGSHKNIGGFLFGILFGLVCGILKYLYLDRYFTDYVLLQLSFGETIFLYVLMSFGALFGDILKSVAKRFLDIPAHSPWIPFDEIDHSTVSLFLASLFFPISLSIAIAIIGSFLLLHLIANIIGYKLGIKDVPF